MKKQLRRRNKWNNAKIFIELCPTYTHHSMNFRRIRVVPCNDDYKESFRNTNKYILSQVTKSGYIQVDKNGGFFVNTHDTKALNYFIDIMISLANSLEQENNKK